MTARYEAAHGLVLDPIFRARSVAIVGASADGRKLNGIPLQILRMTGFAGAIYPVNPKYADIDGVRCYPTIAALPEVPDVALVLVPAADVPDVLEQCGRKGIRAAVVVSSGFEEVDCSGRLVAAVRDVCARHRIALVGPNCEGVWSVRDNVLLTFGSAAKREVLAHAPVAILSQSGSMAGAVARQLQDSGFGCAYVVSVGNETVVGMLDYLDYMIAQDDVRVVLLFLEGLKDGQRLVRLARRARERGIVIVALKSGSSSAGRDAVASHTGKMTTAHAIYKDVFAQAGVIQVESLVELIEAAEVFSSVPLPRHGGSADGVAVFSIPGGTRALTADLCETRNVPLARFANDTVTRLAQTLPRFGVATNPTDMTGQVLSQPELFETALRIVAADPHTSGLLVQLANRGPADALRYRSVIADAARARSLPVVISFLADAMTGPERREFARHGLLCARDPGDAVRYFDWLYRASALAAEPARIHMSAEATDVAKVDPQRTDRLPPAWPGAMQFLAEAGIAVPAWAISQPEMPASAACRGLRFPVALKALPEHAEHKTERGLLRLQLASAQQVETAAVELRRVLGDRDAPLLVQEMAPAGIEVVLSVITDPDFGAVLALGSGGILVELMRDIGYLSLPADERDVDALLSRLALTRLIAGFRGAPAADRGALVRAALGLARAFAARESELTEVEINPLIVLSNGRGVIAVDALLKHKTGASSSGSASGVVLASLNEAAVH